MTDHTLVDAETLATAMTTDTAPSRFWVFGRGSLGATDRGEAVTLAVELLQAVRKRTGLDPFVSDHELCETQVVELVAVLQRVKDHTAFRQLTHALQDAVRHAIKNRGIRTP